MKFPGRRRHKHYFPVEAKDPLTNQLNATERLHRSYITGIDQIVVDIEAKVDQAFLDEFQLRRGMSQVIDNDITNALYDRLKLNDMVDYEFAGGTVGNTMHNYSVLADDRSVLLGVMSENIKIGSYAYRFLCNNSSRVDLDYLQPVDGPIGRCFTLIDETGERTFAISAGLMNYLKPESIDKELIEGSSALVISAYLMRTQGDETMTEATMQAIKYANDANVPVVLTLGTKFLIEQDPTWCANFVEKHVDILAMNEEEGQAITGYEDPLLAADKALDWVDLVICTAGEKGLFMAGFVDDSCKRETEYPLLPGAIPDFNRYEFSRAMRKVDCENPIKAYSHTAPFMGGPDSIKNTNGAGDCALAAVLHDL